MSAAMAVQQAVFDTLAGDFTIAGMVVGVYDHVSQPPDAAADGDFPYLVIGDDDVAEWDSDTFVGAEVTADIRSWTRYRGRKQAKEIEAAVYAVLHRNDNLAIAGFHTVGVDFQFSETLVEADGLTRQGVMRYLIRVQQE